VVDRAGTVRGWNRWATTIFGWTDKEAMGRNFADLIIPARHRKLATARLVQLAQEPGEGEFVSRVDVTACRADGSEFPVELGVVRTEADDGDMLLLGFARDVTAERRAMRELETAQEQLRRSEELYRYVVELGSFIPWIADEDGSLLTIGQRWTEWTGTPVEAGLGEGWVGFVHPDDAPEVDATWQRAVRSGDRLEIDYRLRFAGGDYRWCRARTTKRTDVVAGAASWYGTLEDVHEHRLADEASRRAQAELSHVSRLSAMGAMASVIAHDLNQPLTAVAHYVRGCKQLLPTLAGDNRDAIAEAMEDADRGIVRAGDIVRRMREFVQRGTVECQAEDLAELVEEACRLALIDAPMRGVTHRLSANARCTVMVDRVQIQQVVVNLLRNAVEALKDQPRREIRISIGQEKPGYCEVAICDTGRGIPAEAAERMFDPFFTTRKDGMGIGLSISRMIIEAHGGTIWNDSKAGQGTTIRFTLPIASGHESPASS
jgi:two-component system sensor kinase FixL